MPSAVATCCVVVGSSAPPVTRPRRADGATVACALVSMYAVTDAGSGRGCGGLPGRSLLDLVEEFLEPVTLTVPESAVLPGRSLRDQGLQLEQPFEVGPDLSFREFDRPLPRAGVPEHPQHVLGPVGVFVGLGRLPRPFLGLPEAAEPYGVGPDLVQQGLGVSQSRPAARRRVRRGRRSRERCRTPWRSGPWPAHERLQRSQ